MHALIIGSPGVGKSTLIRRVLAELGRPVFGFETKKEDSPEEGLPGCPVYLYEAGKAHRQGEEHLIGRSGGRQFSVHPEVFDRFAPKLRAPVPPGHIVLLDELGTMESASKAFCSAVLALLDGDAPVIAAVKDKSTPFLDAVRAHPGGKCFRITEDNRDALFEDVLTFVSRQLTPGK